MAAEHPSDSIPDSHPSPGDVPVESDAGEEMPEFEELTPELMEDECLRGDVMLRGAIILLALLLGWTRLTESSLFVQIRSGEYMLSHGILPPRTDVFSATAAGRPWYNPAWLSDILLGGLHQVLGMSALTVVCAVTVAAAFICLGRVRVPGVSTWWASCCGFLALIAMFPLYQPGSSTWNILGLAVLMMCLARESLLPADAENLGRVHRFPWSLPYLPVLFLLWINMSSRAWIGLLLLLLFMIGDSISRRIHKKSQSHRDWGVVLVTFMVAMLFTPWPFQPILGFLTFARDAQAMQTYSMASEFFPRLVYGLRDPAFWRVLDLYPIAALLLVIASLLTLLLNSRRVNLGWWGVWLGMNLLSLVDGECVCYAAMVNAAIATFNGQEWYRSRFSMAYSISTPSVLWARGGRAVMVLTFFLVAYLAMNGAFMGAQGRRLGLGLDPRWAARIESLGKDVVTHSYSSHIFPTLPSQGDVLIWLGKEPFVDSRISLYLSGKENLLALHQKVRAALFAAPSPDKPVDAEIWKKPLLDFQTYDVLVRLWGPVPAYDPFLRLLTTPDWALTGLGAAGANFTRIDLPDEELRKHVEEFAATRFAQQAFRPAVKPVSVDLQAVWPLPVSRYDSWLIQKIQVPPNSAELASHYDQLLNVLDQSMPLDQVCGLAFLAIRDCRQALAQNPNDALTYRVLARAYRVLQQVEQQVSMATRSPLLGGAYESQILAAAQAAVVAGGDNPLDLQLLLDTFLRQQQADTSLDALIRLEQALKKVPSGMISADRLTELMKLKEDLQKNVDSVKAQIADARSNGADRSRLVAFALQGRCPALALSLLEEDLTELERSPEMKLLYGSLLMQNGNFADALQTLEGMESMMTGSSLPPQMQPIASQWRGLTATANLATHNLGRAEELWAGEDKSYVKSAIQSLLQMPFAAMGIPIQYEIWPAYYARMAATAAIEIPDRLAQLKLQSARAELEGGRLGKATEQLQQLLKEYPKCSQRFLAAFYLGLLTNKPVQVEPMPVEEQADSPEQAKPETTPDTQEKPAADSPEKTESSPAPEEPAAPSSPESSEAKSESPPETETPAPESAQE
ncbi:hypothetical protein SH661x_000650 [Planctomicrobium sp. SH661]|uniref:tetratricopeptide repeat protein n=1 Tax=Planctomicrobium sp. SH661 TaxID=3448124 RepID=UPI003F5C137E